MKLWAKIALPVVAIAGASLLWVAQSDWLRDQVLRAVVSRAETVTGGRVELGAFRWDWHTLTVTAERLVIHGTEPAGEAPLLRVESAQARLRIISFLSRTVAIESIRVSRPEAHVMLMPGGGTNLPVPKLPSHKQGLQPLLDLKVGSFDVRDGLFAFAAKTVRWNVNGGNLEAHLDYDGAGQRYAGSVALNPLHVAGVNLKLSANAALERDRITFGPATAEAGDWRVDVSAGAAGPFAAPVLTASYTGHVSCKDSPFPCPRTVAGSADVHGSLRLVSDTDYQAQGEFTGTGDYAKLRGVHASGQFEANPAGIALHAVRGGVLGGTFAGEATLNGAGAYTAQGRIDHFDLREAAALETTRPLPYDGLVSGTFGVRGRAVTANLSITPAGAGPAARGEIALHYDPARALIELGHSTVELPHSRAEVSGTLGSALNVKASTEDMADVMPLLDMLAPPAGFGFAAASFEGTVAGPLGSPRIAGHAAARGLKISGQNFEAVSGDVAVSAGAASVRSAQVTLGDVRAQGSGSLTLRNWQAWDGSQVEAALDVHNAAMPRVLAMAGHKELEVTGTLSGTARIAGTLSAPAVTADIALAKGTIYGQPFDSVTGRLQRADRNAETLTGLFVSGPKRVNFSGRYDGALEFNLTSNTMPLNQIAVVRARQPDIRGFGKFHADGTLLISQDAKHEVQFSLTSLNADASANSLELDERNLGDARFTAQTKDGVLEARFDSNAAKAVIHGEGSMKLAGDYPVNARVAFSSVGLNAVAALIAKEEDARSLNFDGEAQGEATLAGPAVRPRELTARFDVPRLEVRPLPGSEFAKSAPRFALTNDGPVRATLSATQIRIDSAHFRAPQTDLTVDGTIALTGDAPLNLRLAGDVNLAVLQTLDKDLTSEGALSLNAAVRGVWKRPDIGGRAVLRNGSLRYAGFANGLSNAEGEIAFSGERATIRSFSAESGGGKVEATGFAALGDGTVNFRVEAKAQAIRVRYPEGISSVSNASLTFFGTPKRSEVSGTVTVQRVSINPRSDAATILESTEGSLQGGAARTGFAANMNLDVKVQTAPDVALQTSVAKSLQADASLTLRGTAANPAVLGRINITQGEIVFFGNKYAINQGSVSFFNPARIDPILNVDLETKARGVDLVLTVAGPMNALAVSYRSDPPLQFADIVTLLATGRAPGDPTLAVSGNVGQASGFQQLGASALLGQAISNPVAGRLERFFGVSRLKIDPQLTGVTGSPEARLTLEQQITPDILFTYISDVSSTSTQLIRAEFSFSRNWSAILIREESGYVGLDFAYKKRFR